MPSVVQPPSTTNTGQSTLGWALLASAAVLVAIPVTAKAIKALGRPVRIAGAVPSDRVLGVVASPGIASLVAGTLVLAHGNRRVTVKLKAEPAAYGTSPAGTASQEAPRSDSDRSEESRRTDDDTGEQVHVEQDADRKAESEEPGHESPQHSRTGEDGDDVPKGASPRSTAANHALQDKTGQTRKLPDDVVAVLKDMKTEGYDAQLVDALEGYLKANDPTERERYLSLARAAANTIEGLQGHHERITFISLLAVIGKVELFTDYLSTVRRTSWYYEVSNTPGDSFSAVHWAALYKSYDILVTIRTLKGPNGRAFGDDPFKVAGGTGGWWPLDLIALTDLNCDPDGKPQAQTPDDDPALVEYFEELYLDDRCLNLLKVYREEWEERFGDRLYWRAPSTPTPLIPAAAPRRSSWRRSAPNGTLAAASMPAPTSSAQSLIDRMSRQLLQGTQPDSRLASSLATLHSSPAASASDDVVVPPGTSAAEPDGLAPQQSGRSSHRLSTADSAMLVSELSALLTSGPTTWSTGSAPSSSAGTVRSSTAVPQDEIGSPNRSASFDPNSLLKALDNVLADGPSSTAPPKASQGPTDSGIGALLEELGSGSEQAALGPQDDASEPAPSEPAPLLPKPDLSTKVAALLAQVRDQVIKLQRSALEQFNPNMIFPKQGVVDRIAQLPFTQPVKTALSALANAIANGKQGDELQRQALKNALDGAGLLPAGAVGQNPDLLKLLIIVGDPQLVNTFLQMNKGLKDTDSGKLNMGSYIQMELAKFAISQQRLAVLAPLCHFDSGLSLLYPDASGSLPLEGAWGTEAKAAVKLWLAHTKNPEDLVLLGSQKQAFLHELDDDLSPIYASSQSAPESEWKALLELRLMDIAAELGYPDIVINALQLKWASMLGRDASLDPADRSHWLKGDRAAFCVDHLLSSSLAKRLSPAVGREALYMRFLVTHGAATATYTPQELAMRRALTADIPEKTVAQWDLNAKPVQDQHALQQAALIRDLPQNLNRKELNTGEVTQGLAMFAEPVKAAISQRYSAKKSRAIDKAVRTALTQEFRLGDKALDGVPFVTMLALLGHPGLLNNYLRHKLDKAQDVRVLATSTEAYKGWTPAHWAASRGQTGAVFVLTKFSGDVILWTPNANGILPLQQAAVQFGPAVAQAFCDKTLPVSALWTLGSALAPFLDKHGARIRCALKDTPLPGDRADFDGKKGLDASPLVCGDFKLALTEMNAKGAPETLRQTLLTFFAEQMLGKAIVLDQLTTDQRQVYDEIVKGVQATTVTGWLNAISDRFTTASRRNAALKKV